MHTSSPTHGTSHSHGSDHGSDLGSDLGSGHADGPARPELRGTRRQASRPAAVAALAAVALTSGAVLQSAPAAEAAPRAVRAGVDLGSPGLPEARSVTRPASGVSVTTIVRGQKAATNATRGTTQAGPWRIRVATIDAKAKGQLRTAIGSDIARVEGVSTLGRWSGSTVAVNGSYFSQGRATAPGDMVGLAVNGGTIVSQPQRVAGHIGVLMDSRTKSLRMDNYSWKSTLSTPDATLFLDAVNTPVSTPPGCGTLTDPTACTQPGQLVRITPHYAAGRTPSGPGAEVVFDRSGCVVSAKKTRGTTLSASRTAIQATGVKAAQLLAAADTKCPTYEEKVFGRDGKQAALTSTTFGVAGRYQLVQDGEIVAPTNSGSFFGRHPRTIIGRAAGGSVMLVTVDGRSTASVGATLREAARLAKSLGMVDAANLDGGGSTAMAVRGKIVNTPVGGRERAVGDAVVFMP